MASINTDSVDRELRRLAGQSRKVLKRSVDKGAQVVATKLRQNTPFYDGKRDGKWRAQRQIDRQNGNVGNYPHLKDDIVVGNVDQFGRVQIGFGQKTYWRAHFVESGTINQRPQNFMERTTHETRSEFIVIVEDEIKRGFGL
ncbi:HK97-gp10 family putative phage morphogenesis protein [Kurthia populi]|uniref:HK97-gp10 family putative phage morphogenesis protein n=1 Tax=Kurthia populi TaxID=1562132 RepID=A0ABW5Y3B9_9BACL